MAGNDRGSIAVMKCQRRTGRAVIPKQLEIKCTSMNVIRVEKEGPEISFS
jgi:hypothetical protein